MRRNGEAGKRNARQRNGDAMKQEVSKCNATEKPCCEKTGNAKEQNGEAAKRIARQWSGKEHL
jgi:hypothetical protein